MGGRIRMNGSEARRKSSGIKIASRALLVSGTVLLAAILLVMALFTADVVRDSAARELLSVRKSTHLIFEHAAYALYTYYTHPSALKLMNYDGLSSFEVARLFYDIGLIECGLNAESTLYIYNGDAGMIYDMSGAFEADAFYDPWVMEMLSSADAPKKLCPYARRLIRSDLRPEKQVYTLFMFDQTTGPVRHAMVLNLTEDTLNDDLFESEAGKLLALDAAGNVVKGSGAHPFMTQLAGSWREELARSESGCMVNRVDGRRSLISWTTQANYGWTFISVLPIGELLGDRRLVGVYVIAGICLAILLTLMRNYFLFKKSDRAMKRMEAEADVSFDQQQAVLRKFIAQGFVEDNGGEQLARNHIQFDMERRFVLMWFQMDRTIAYWESHELRQRKRQGMALVRALNAACPETLRHETLEVNSAAYVLILNVEQRPDEETLCVMARDVAATLERVSGETFSCVIGDEVEDYQDLHEHYGYCHSAIGYKLFEGVRTIMTAREARRRDALELTGDAETLKQIDKNLRLGHAAEATALFTGLMEQVRQSAYSTLYSVTFEMSRLIMRLAEDMGEFFETEWYRMLPAARVGIDHFDSLALLEQTYIRAIDDICAYVCGKRRDHEMAQKHDDLIREVDQIIAQNYEDANLNADVIAERFSMSSAYLRRLYRKETGCSLNDRLMNVRLQKICDLLAGTDRPLNDIAEASGIRNANYLYTVFKKTHGMTPIEYRALHGANRGD